VSLIGRTAKAVSSRHALSLVFDNGAVINVLAGLKNIRYAEAFQFGGPNTVFVVEQNA